MSLYLGDQPIAGVSTPIQGARNIGQLIYSLIPLTDAGLHLTDGALIDGNGVYSAFYNYMLNLYGDGTNPPNYFTDETSWQSSVTTYGVCGKFVLNTTNHTIRLPKVTGIVEGTLDASALGNLVEAGLPDHKHNTVISNDQSSAGTGYDKLIPGQGSGARGTGTFLSTNVVDSNVYGNSDKVQPQTIKGYYYIVLATTTKTEIEVDIDEIATDLNGKVDKTSPHIISTYSNGVNWYKIYSDGWVEQGTIIQANTGTWTFLVPFVDTNYNAQLSVVWTGSSAGWDYHTITSKTTTTLTFATADNSTNQLVARGYKA